MALLVHRFFSNVCGEAMSRDRQVFGGELEAMTFEGMPPGEDWMISVDPPADAACPVAAAQCPRSHCSITCWG